MAANNKPILVYSTCPSLEVAEKIGAELVRRGLCACVNILPRMISLYVWEGALQRDEEVVMLAKSGMPRAEAIVAAITELHPYDVPAVLVLPTNGGAEEFIRWIGAQTSSGE